MTTPDRSGGVEFSDEDVVSAYDCRPDYPSALSGRLVGLMPARSCVLDLGSGPGKIARMLAPHVERVLAVDPSSAMLKHGAALDGGAQTNITWVEAFAEDLDLEAASLGLAVAGASIHWMDPSCVFPKIARALAPGASMAIVNGDAPSAAPWLSSYQNVIRTWVARLGGIWNGQAHKALTTAHEPWLAVKGVETFSTTIRQSVADLINCEHSRATWSRARMGALANDFDADLRATLDPWSSGGLLEFDVHTTLVWGAPRLNRLNGVPTTG